MFESIVPITLTALSGAALIGGVLHMTASSAPLLDRLDNRTLEYLAASGILLLFRHVKSLAYDGLPNPCRPGLRFSLLQIPNSFFLDTHVNQSYSTGYLDSILCLQFAPKCFRSGRGGQGRGSLRESSFPPYYSKFSTWSGYQFVPLSAPSRSCSDKRT